MVNYQNISQYSSNESQKKKFECMNCDNNRNMKINLKDTTFGIFLRNL